MAHIHVSLFSFSFIIFSMFKCLIIFSQKRTTIWRLAKQFKVFSFRLIKFVGGQGSDRFCEIPPRAFVLRCKLWDLIAFVVCDHPRENWILCCIIVTSVSSEIQKMQVLSIREQSIQPFCAHFLNALVGIMLEFLISIQLYAKLNESFTNFFLVFDASELN